MAARKTTTAARKSTVSSIAAAKVDFDLDGFESERNYKPFVAKIGGKSITFTDPGDLDWRDLMATDDPETFAQNCVAEKDRETFLAARITVDQMLNGLMPAYRDHYGLGDTQGN